MPFFEKLFFGKMKNLNKDIMRRKNNRKLLKNICIINMDIIIDRMNEVRRKETRMKTIVKIKISRIIFPI